MTDPITRMQEDVAAILGEDVRLADVTIQQEDKGTITEILNRALQGVAPEVGKKAGLVVVVDMPALKVAEPDCPVLDFVIEQTVTILEKPMFNRAVTGTQITAAGAVEIVAHRLQYRGTGLGTMLCQRAEPISAEEAGKVSVGYTLFFNLRRALGNEARGACPIMTLGEGTCELIGGGHSGEVIYFTLDGSAPVPGLAGTQTYSAPFAIEEGQTVRASTKATGLNLSDFNETIVQAGDVSNAGLVTGTGEQFVSSTGRRRVVNPG